MKINFSFKEHFLKFNLNYFTVWGRGAVKLPSLIKVHGYSAVLHLEFDHPVRM